MSETISELKSCIDKETGNSYELLCMEDGSINICDYAGMTVASFGNIVEAAVKYIIF